MPSSTYCTAVSRNGETFSSRPNISDYDLRFEPGNASCTLLKFNLCRRTLAPAQRCCLVRTDQVVNRHHSPSWKTGASPCRYCSPTGLCGDVKKAYTNLA